MQVVVLTLRKECGRAARVLEFLCVCLNKDYNSTGRLDSLKPARGNLQRNTEGLPYLRGRNGG